MQAFQDVCTYRIVMHTHTYRYMHTLIRTYSIHICVTFPNIYLYIYIYIYILHIHLLISSCMSPRCFPLLVGTPGFMTQGKAGNQLGALRFSRGHFLQMMDVTCPRKHGPPPFFQKVCCKNIHPKIRHCLRSCFPVAIFLEAFLVSIGCSMRRTWEPFLVKPARCHLSYDVSSLIGQTGASWACCQPHGCDLKKPRVCLRCKEIEKYCPLSDYI